MNMYATDDLVYPYSDGKPMAENLEQAIAIRYLIAGLKDRFFDQPDVLVEGNFFWYPVEGEPTIAVAPDVAVIEGIDVDTFTSYRPWRFGGRLTLAVEVWSPSNTPKEMRNKHAFYDRYGVHEYWEFNPASGRLRVWERRGASLIEIVALDNWHSTVCDARPAVEHRQLVVYGADGRRWPTDRERIQRARDTETALDHEAAARMQAETARDHEAAARIQAETARDHEAAARTQAETAREHEAAARAQADERVRELSAELARLRDQ